jgi:anti-sigma28 factor (negative regulator of flagellin synthesis)
MKIDNERLAGTASPAVQSAEVEKTQRLDRYRQSDSGPSTASDQVSLSGLASRILQAGEARATEHAARVQALSKAYQAGRYAVDSRQLSPKLVSAWLAGGPPKKE